MSSNRSDAPEPRDGDRQIGRRLKLRDLHVFLTVARRGSTAKAAAELGVIPACHLCRHCRSAVIAGLEHAIGVRLFDRQRLRLQAGSTRQPRSG
ncbi:MAG: LysR family transcriptional regulator [Hyphomicrobiaceae bacterium]